MKNRQKALSVLLTLAIAVGLLPWTVLPARAAAEVTVTDETYEWENGNTYKVTSNVTFGAVRIKVSGTVSLVLGEGTTLTVPLGIRVPADATLNISGTGALVIEGSSYYDCDNKAGIGGDSGEACGTVTIDGGTITVQGGKNAAGIGGGYCGSGGKVTINGGTVTATGGQSGAGIGSGCREGVLDGGGGTVEITGGTVTATGGESAAGIGGGSDGAGGTVTINGGTVTANGGQNGAGIGGGLFSEDNGSLTRGESQVVYGGGDPNPTTILNKTATDRPRYMIVKTFSSEELHDLANATVNGVKSFYRHTGEAIAIEYTVTTANGASLNKGTDYTETVEMGGKSVQTVQAKGEYTLTITGKSPYTGSQTFHFIVSDAIPVTAETTAFEEDTPYRADGTVTVGSRIAVSDKAFLILAEGAKLTVPKGISVPEGAALNISGTGELVIDGVDDDCAGIGGEKNQTAGAVNIFGGTITVTGGALGAGIGGGCYRAGGTVTIRGGTVTVTGGGQAAGIGGGYNGSGGAVTISGGTVTATGGQRSAGIGGGDGGDGGTVTVTGGTVYATGGAPYTAGGQQCAAVGGTLNLSNVAAGESDDGNNYTALTNNSSKKPYLHFCAPSLTEGVTAPKGAVLVCAAYEGGKMTGVQTLTLAADCIGKAASELLNVPTSGQYKLFLLDKTTYAPLCAAWDNKQ